MNSCITRSAIACGFLVLTGVADAQEQPGLNTKLLTTEVVVAQDGRFTETLHAEIQLNSEAAVLRSGQISLPFDASIQKVEVLEAHTLKRNGSKLPVASNVIREQLSPGLPQLPMYSDQRVKLIVFPQLAVGDTIVYTAKIVAVRPLISGQFQFADAFAKSVAFDEVRETVTAPRTLPLAVENHGVEFTRRQQGNRIVYVWHYSAPHAVPAEVTEVSVFDRTPRFLVSSFRDFAALGRTYAEMAAPQEVVTPRIRAITDQATRGANDRREQAKRIYEWVSKNIRYVALELGRGALVPHAAETVLANGYGDCKDHVVLLATMLKAKGINSEAALINNGNAYSLTKIPTFLQLNHVINYLPESDLYLDSTGSLVPFDVLPLQEYGKPVVFASLQHSGTGSTPVLPPDIAGVETHTASRLSKDGVLSGVTKTKASGPYSVLLRALGLGIQAVGRQTAAAQQLAALGYSGATGTFDADPLTELGPSYEIKGTFESPGWGDRIKTGSNFLLPGGLRVLGLSGDGMMGPFVAGRLAPDEPVPCFSAHASEIISLEIPAGYHFSSVPKDSVVAGRNIRFTARWTLSGHTLSVHRDFRSHIEQPLCSPEIRAANASALQQIADSYETQLSLESTDTNETSGTRESAQSGSDDSRPVFEAAVAAARQQDYQRATQLFSELLDRKLSADQRYTTYMDRATVYMQEGQLVMAAGDAATAIRIHPQRPQAYLMRAWLRQRMNDNASALLDYGTAIRLQPDMVNSHLERGQLAMQMRKYDVAVEDFSAVLRANPEDQTARESRGIADEIMGRYDEAVADFTHARTTNNPDSLLSIYLCDALSRSAKPSAAIPNCTLLIKSNPYTAILYEARGYAYFRLGNYSSALSDFDAATRRSSGRAQFLYARGVAETKLGKTAVGNQDMARAEQMSPGVGKTWRQTSISP